MSVPLPGLGLSTQQLKALLINRNAVVVHDLAVGYDKDSPVLTPVRDHSETSIWQLCRDAFSIYKPPI